MNAPTRILASSRADVVTPADDAPPDVELLADAVEEIERLPSTPALEEVLHLVAMVKPRIAQVLRQRRALRLGRELRREYPRSRELAARIAREVDAAPETIRGWLVEAGVFQPGPERL